MATKEFAPPTLEEILDHCCVGKEQLERPCSHEDIKKIAQRFLPQWRVVAPRLGLDSSEVEAVEEDGKYASDRRLQALQKWKSKFGFKATYMHLVEVLHELGYAEEAERICQLVGTSPLVQQQQSTSQEQSSRQTDSELAASLNLPSQAEPEECQPCAVPTNDKDWELSESFAYMFAAVVSLLSQCLHVHDLKRYLMSMVHPKTKQHYYDPEFYRDCTSTEGVLDCLRTQFYIHPLHVHVLTMIVVRYGCNKCKRLVEDYRSKLPKLAPLKRSRAQLSDEQIEIATGSMATSTKKVKVCMEGDSDIFNLQDVSEVKRTLHTATDIDYDMLNFAKQEPGSIILTFLVPATMESIFRRIGDSEALAASGILWITFDSVEVYRRKWDVHKSHHGMVKLGGAIGHALSEEMQLLSVTGASQQGIMVGASLLGTSDKGQPRVAVAKYRCTCGFKWQLRNTRGEEMACKICHKPVHPYKIEPKEEVLRRMFGEFHCSHNDCKQNWFSGNAWKGKGQECHKCGTMCFPRSLWPLLRHGPDEGHLQHQCQMCKKLGRNCQDVSTVPADDESGYFTSRTTSEIDSDSDWTSEDSDEDELLGPFDV